ncbi:MAG: FecR domain-containing protein [Bryobacteraceae bacterium]
MANEPNDQFENLLREVREEPLDTAAFEQARDRVWSSLSTATASGLCAGFRASFAAYSAGALDPAKRMLLEDHLSRCAECRQALHGTPAAGHTEPRVIAIRSRPRVFWKPYAAAAGLALAMLYLGRDPLDRALAASGPRATVETVAGEVHLLNGKAARPGTQLDEAEAIRTGGGSHAVLRLRDGSRVEMNERTQLALRAAWSGLSIRLDRGDILMEAAKQRRGHLRVIANDTLASVKGTVFAVSSGSGGSVVSVVEGSVAVEHGSSSRLLSRGEQDGSAAPRAGGVPVAIAWSENAEKYVALLTDLAHIEKQIASIDTGTRTESKLAAYLPAGSTIYAAIPNASSAIEQALAMVEQRARESATLREWWDSAGGRAIRAHLVGLQTISPLLGDEMVFVLAPDPTRAGGDMPVVLAEMKSDAAAIDRALQQLAAGGTFKASWRASNGILVIADTPAKLAAIAPKLGTGSTGAFAADIRARYQRGVGILIGYDVEAIVASRALSAAAGTLGMDGARRLFLEQRSATQNEASLRFQGARQGIASWLAAPGAGGSADYISSDAVFAASASTRNPRQAFDELVNRVAATDVKFATELRDFETKTGINVSADIAASLGTDFSFAVETPTVPIPGWIAVIEAVRPGSLDTTAQRIIDAFNQQLSTDKQSMRLTLSREAVNGRSWTSVKSAGSTMALHWTQDAGYLVLSTDRAIATRAIAIRGAGSGLTRSASFRQQLPEGSGAHHSAFFWVNTKGALSGLLPAGQNTALRSLLDSRDPVLVTIDGETEQIRAASRTRLTSLVLDLILAAGAGNQTAATQHARTAD